MIDTPGLISGASKNKGLGYAFLDHIAKCKTLICVLDAVDNPTQNYAMLLNELKAYDGKLLDRIKLVVLNKCDLLEDVAITDDYGIETITVSALTGFGMDKLNQRMKELLCDKSEDIEISE